MAETEGPEADSLTEDEARESVTELLEQLGREVSALVVCEARLAASRHAPELRRAARDVAAALAAALAFLTAFVLANAAAMRALSTTLDDWMAPLVLAAAWTVVGGLLALYVRARARRVTGRDVKNAEEARTEAEQVVRETLEQLIPAISREVALAAIPVASGIASGVIDAGEEMLEDVDEFVDGLAEDVPGGGAVNQMWDIALMPGRLGVRVATAFIRLGDSSSRTDDG